MAKLVTFAIMLAAMRQEDAVVREAMKGWRHPWAEFGEGSTVTYKETTKRPEIDAGGNFVLKSEATEVVWTLGSVDGQKANLKVESEGRQAEILHFLTPPNWSKGKGERKADEDLTVGTSKIACRVTAIVVDGGKDASEVTTIWQNPEAPGWAVKRRSETFVKEKRNTFEEEVLLAIGEKLKVGEKELSCYVVEETTEVESGRRIVRKEWRSEEVPGRVVRRETRYYQGGRENTAATSTMEVVNFRSRK